VLHSSPSFVGGYSRSNQSKKQAVSAYQNAQQNNEDTKTSQTNLQAAWF
jgi:hypothetical protein